MKEIKYDRQKAVDYAKEWAYKRNPNKYNPGQSNYQQLVNKRANEVWGSPEIQDWYRRYNKGWPKLWTAY